MIDVQERQRQRAFAKAWDARVEAGWRKAAAEVCPKRGHSPVSEGEGGGRRLRCSRCNEDLGRP